MLKEDEIKRLEYRVKTLEQEIISNTDQSKLYDLHRQCDFLLNDSIKVVELTPYDISFQEPVWKIRDEIIKLCNLIKQKMSFLENQEK